MKALNVKEIDNLVQSLRFLLGSRLQESIVSKREVGLGFWGEGGLAWVWMDLDPQKPILLPLPKAQSPSAKPARPLLLFLKAHFMGRRLIDVCRDTNLGRAIRLEFHSDAEERRCIEVRLWPHGQNVIAVSGESRVSFSPIAAAESEQMGGIQIHLQARSVKDLIEDFLRPTEKESGRNPREKAEQRLQREVAKGQEAIAKVEAEIKRKSQAPLREIGQWLVEHQNLDVPDEWTPYIDKRRGLSWNIASVFKTAKENERKILGTQERLKKLRERMDALLQVKDPLAHYSREVLKPVRSATTKQSIKTKHRTIHVGEELRAVVGRSAKDNLALLRQAHAWDYWLHLKDYPGAHGFILRNRRQKVSEEVFRSVGQALVEETFGAKSRQKETETFELVVCECRHVRPIRGDKLGRVTYHEARTIPFRYRNST